MWESGDVAPQIRYLNRIQRSGSRPVDFTPGERGPGADLIGGWVRILDGP